MLLVSGDMNILTLTLGTADGLSETAEYFALEEESAPSSQVFSVLPVIVRGVYTGTIIAAAWDGYETELFMTELGYGPEPDKPILTELELSLIHI